MEHKKYPSAIWPVAEATSNIAFSWFLHLRWGAVFCQAILIFIAYSYLEIALPIVFVSIIILFEAASNLFFTFLTSRKKGIPEWLFGLVMFLDIILLTALLYYTGGPMNPFTFLYLVHIVIGAILMRDYWSWSLMVFTVLSYSSLFIVDPEVFGKLPLMLPGGFIGGVDIQETCHPAVVEYTLLSDHMKLHLKGMLLAFAITAFFIVFFVGKIQKALEEHQQTLVSLEEERARSEKLSSLATLSAGAAHEFSTPLSTIAVAAGEMLHQLKEGKMDEGLMEDAQLIKDQIRTCKDILYQMAADAGEHLGEALEKHAVSHVVSKILHEFSEEDQARIKVDNAAADISVLIPLRTLVRTVKGLVKNGLDASQAASPVFLKCFYDENFLYFQVTDQGCGMDAESLQRAREPFFTTKEQGKGLGLGLFLAQNIAQQFGGELTISSDKLKGTVVTISFALPRKGIELQNFQPDKEKMKEKFSMQSIILVDDEDHFRGRLARAFTNRGYTVYQAADVDEALKKIREHQPALALVDLKMPEKSGLDLIREAKVLMPTIKIVVLTGYGSIATATEAIKLGAHYYLPKPADVDDILNAFEKDADMPDHTDGPDFEVPSLARAEWEHIQRVLNDCDNNITAAAHKLGIHRRTLQRKLYKYAPHK